MIRFFSAVLLLSLLGLVAHSFTQVDPGLYVLSSPWFVTFQDQMVQFGLWSRFASGLWFITFLGLAFVSYFYLLANWQKISVWLLAITGVGICFLSFIFFPAGLSHDIYNYIIYAKTLVIYHQNPLSVAPNNFINDPILPYVHWATSPSRYGFVWIAISSFAFFIGQQSLLLTFIAFKTLYLFISGAILLLLSNFADLLKLPRRKVFVFWVFNPYVVIEFLFSSHTDALVGLLLLLAIFFVLGRKFSKAWIVLAASAGVKIISLPLLVPFFLKEFFWIKTDRFLKTCVLFAYFGSAIIISQWSINPWYFSLPILLSTLIIENKFYRYLALSLSVACELRYAPYFFLGYFDPHIKIRVQLFLLALIPFIGWVIWGQLRFIKVNGINTSSVRRYLKSLQLI
jgi:hypothetical protein